MGIYNIRIYWNIHYWLQISILIKLRRRRRRRRILEWYTIKQDDRKSLLTIDITDNIGF